MTNPVIALDIFGKNEYNHMWAERVLGAAEAADSVVFV